MSKIKNTSSLNGDEIVDKLRAAVEHRATWMGLMCLEAKKAGADWESIARKAIKKTGGIHGERILDSMEGSREISDFLAPFIPETTRKLFEMDVQEEGPEKLYVEFHYCPLVSAWQKLGIDEEMIDTLCDIAMDGDRGIAEKVGYDFTLGNTIAKGSRVCEVCFERRGG